MKKIILIENYSYDFLTLRLDYAKYLITKGYEVYVIIPNDGYATKIKQENITVYEYNLSRKSLNPFRIVKSIMQIYEIIKDIKPDIIHSYRIQPNFIINIIKPFIKNVKIVSHITGLGYAFASNSLQALFYRRISILIYKIIAKYSDTIIFQNDDDMVLLQKEGVELDTKSIVIKGSGVNEDEFNINNVDSEKIKRLKKELNIEKNTIVIITIARLIWEKGIREFVKAGDILTKKYDNVLFISVGWSDYDNPSSVPSEFLRKHSSNKIKFLGKREDIKELLAISDIFVLPSYYREGIPRATLEAMAMSLPVITTNVPGCKLTVTNGINGYFVNIKDHEDLVNKLEKLILDFSLRNKMSQNSRIKFLNEFSNTIIYNQIEKVYR